MEKLGKEAMKLRGLSMRTSIFAVALLLIAGSASATLVAVGDPFDSGSWTQPFHLGTVLGFDRMELQMLTEGDSFETIGIGNFSPSNQDWSQTGNNGTLLAAQGNLLTWLQFDISFAGAQSDPFEFHFGAYNGVMQVDDTLASWSGTAWTIESTMDDANIPEPISMVMLGCLGAGMFAARKVSRKRAT